MIDEEAIQYRWESVGSRLDERTYEKGSKVSDAEMAALDIASVTFHPEWNYTIKPRPR